MMIGRMIMYTPEKGAYTPVIAAASAHVREEAAKYKAGYLQPIGKLGKSTSTAKNQELANDLWNLTVQVLRELEVDL